MKNSKTATASDAQAELKRIKAASASLVRRAKKILPLHMPFWTPSVLYVQIEGQRFR